MTVNEMIARLKSIAAEGYGDKEVEVITMGPDGKYFSVKIPSDITADSVVSFY